MSNSGETELQDLSLLEENDLKLADHNLDLSLGDNLGAEIPGGVTYAGNASGYSSPTAPLNPAALSSSPTQSPTHAQMAPQSQPQQPAEAPSMFSIAYYQCYFDVSTKDMKDRLLAALLPIGGPFYDDDQAPQSLSAQGELSPNEAEQTVTRSGNNKPDLYGPFWICTTVIFMLAAVGNLSQYLRRFRYDVGSKLDIEKLTLAATMFYTSLVVFPAILYFVLRTYSSARSLVTLISLYGYSFAIYIPAAALSIMPGNAVAWVSVSLAFTISTLFIVRNIYYLYRNGLYSLPAPGAEAEEERQKIGLFLVLGLVSVHFGIALLTKLYFF